MIRTIEQYIKEWSQESENFDSLGVYEKLLKHVPTGKILEIGCGAGISTRCLLEGEREVVAIEKIAEFADKVKQELNIEVIHKDIFQLQQQDFEFLNKFQPNIIIGWFIGADGRTILEKIDITNTNIQEFGKKYRENVEDRIVELAKNDLLSVEYIHFVARIYVKAGYSLDELKKSQVDEFNKYVFLEHGFEVVSVDILDWDTSNSQFPYMKNINPKCDGVELTPQIISILAKRLK